MLSWIQREVIFPFLIFIHIPKGVSVPQLVLQMCTDELLNLNLNGRIAISVCYNSALCPFSYMTRKFYGTEEVIRLTDCYRVSSSQMCCNLLSNPNIFYHEQGTPLNSLLEKYPSLNFKDVSCLIRTLLSLAQKQSKTLKLTLRKVFKTIHLNMKL